MSGSSDRKNAAQESSAKAGNTPAVWLEMGVVLLFIAAPAIAYLGSWLLWGDEYVKFDKQFQSLEYRTSLGFTSHLFESLFLKLRFVPVLLFIIWRSGDDWPRFGLVKPQWHKDIAIGFGLWLVVAVVQNLVSTVRGDYYAWTWLRFFASPAPLLPTLLCLASSCATGFSEELVAACLPDSAI